MGIAWFIARKNAAPVIAAIIPGAEKLDDHGQQMIPPGMWIVPIPYADDIRQNPDTTLIRAPDSLADRMRTVVQQLQLPKAQYNQEKYPNPALQWHYRILQAMALEEDLPEKPDDKTIPKYKQRAGPYVIDWGLELEQQYQAWKRDNQSTTTLAKRPGPNDTGGAPKKPKTAATAGVDNVGDDEMRDHYNKNTVNKLTVAALRSWMARKNLDTIGKKADLVERIEGFFESK
ncbi:MAG: ATP-dependent DNA helicase II subunit 1 [Pleopsidium flavum]|nr:MAG: ATP-dependent DNA helicase II subunit 1 [Pleopsidium flavum]